ncbi:multi-sensor hybrid histidine kinase [Calothrix sp. NIES-4071]|nr:multi-sensor hybrid histidine kinase [Calothrix sp. NIES-4071]BAZ59403.1 multi-sensor hybrid histidine kinase [Calothrix sp. NIES-4105]
MIVNTSFIEQNNLLPLNGLRVLLVDDNVDNLEIVGIILKEFSMSVMAATSAKQAREILMKWIPDILISDIAMPDEDGYSFIRSVRNLKDEKIKYIPAIALTSVDLEEWRILAFESGFQMYQVKPIDFNILVTLIAQLAEQATTGTISPQSETSV